MEGIDPRDRMRSTAEELVAASASPVRLRFDDLGPPGNCEVVLTPASPRSARVSWASWGGSFIVSSGRDYWHSEDELDRLDDAREHALAGLAWSEGMVRRISRYGVARVRMRGLAPRLLHSTRVIVRDEAQDEHFDVLEAWEPW